MTDIITSNGEREVVPDFWGRENRVQFEDSTSASATSGSVKPVFPTFPMAAPALVLVEKVKDGVEPALA